MLVLTRRVGETLYIGNDIQVSVLGVSSGHVKIGIEAPQEIRILREEIYQPKQKRSSSNSQNPGSDDSNSLTKS